MTLDKNITPALKVGLFGIGLQAYWAQFAGLEQRLEAYIEVVAQKLNGFGSEVINAGLIDTTEKAFEAGSNFRKADVDIIFLYVTTYALSSTVLPVVTRAKVPVIVLNLSPAAAIDYKVFNKLNDRTVMTSEWLANCSACSIPEIASVFKRAKIPFYQATGMLHDDAIVWGEIEDWVSAAKVAHTMYYNRLGVMGNYYSGMLDIYSNFTLHCATFGGHIEVIEVDELSALKQAVSEEEAEQKMNEFSETFEIQPDCSEFELLRAARTAVALDKLVKKISAWLTCLLP